MAIDPNLKLPVGLILITFGIVMAITSAWIWALVWTAMGRPLLPTGNRKVVPWGLGMVGLVIITFLGIQILFGTTYLQAAYGKNLPRDNSGNAQLTAQDQMTISAGANLLLLLVIPLLLRVGSGASLSDLGFTTKDFGKNVLRGIVTYPLLAPIVFGAFIIAQRVWTRNNHPIETLIRADRSPFAIFLTILAAVIMAPLVEELLFRSIGLGWFLRIARTRHLRKAPDPDVLTIVEEELISPQLVDLDGHSETETFEPISETELLDSEFDPLQVKQGIPIDSVESPPPGDGWIGLFGNLFISVIFGIMHGAQWPAPIPIFILSLGLGVLYQRTGSLVPSIALHMTFNGISTAMLFLAAGAGIPDPAGAANKPAAQSASAAPASKGKAEKATKPTTDAGKPAQDPKDSKSSPSSVKKSG